jgi:uncharacterized membrane protein YfcA
MLNSALGPIITGAALGFLSGLGVGGGSLLILWLTLIANMPQETARSINLMFFLPTALISSLFRWKKGTLQIKTILPAILGGVIAAVLFTWLSRYISSDALRMPFGVLLLATGMRELFYRPRNPK